MQNKKWFGVLLVVIIVIIIGVSFVKSKDTSNIKIGWISDLTNANSKYGDIEAGRLAVEEINKAGGIDGRKIILVEENAKCDSTQTLTVVNKLINVDHVKYILGGHCSTETLAAAPVAEKNKVILLASISTSPDISNSGDYIFRTSAVSVQQAELDADYAVKNNLKNFAVIYENKAYPKPIADAFKKFFEEKGGTVSFFEGYQTEDTDFRSLLSKVKVSGAQAVFIAPQSPDKAALLLKQIKELKINVKVFGNEQIGSSATMALTGKELVEGVIYAEPAFTLENPETKAFVTAYNAKYNTAGLPYGIYTSESYDAVKILANAIQSANGNVEGVKAYLYNVKDYKGASGSITINKKGDGVRQYFLKTIQDGKPVVIK